MLRRYTLAQLQRTPTIRQGQTDDLKVEAGALRVWLSRMRVEDGAPYNNEVTVERLRADARTGWCWETVEQYEAR